MRGFRCRGLGLKSFSEFGFRGLRGCWAQQVSAQALGTSEAQALESRRVHVTLPNLGLMPGAGKREGRLRAGLDYSRPTPESHRLYRAISQLPPRTLAD